MLNYQLIIQSKRQRAWEAFSAAKCLIEANACSSVLNRTYYACFYMVSALLLTKKLSSCKHAGVKSLFNKYFVDIGCIDRKWGSFYSTLFQEKQDCDYGDFYAIDKEYISKNLNEAEVFLKEIELYINHAQSQTKQEREFSWRGALKEIDPNISSVEMQHQIYKDWENHE